MVAQNLDADALIVGGAGHVYVAPYGTALPTDVGASIGAGLNAAFQPLGYTTPDGVKFGITRSIKDIKGWQSFSPLRKIVTEAAQKLGFNLMQFDQYTVPFAFGGGVVSATSGGFKFTPADPADINESSLVVDIQDGTTLHRIVVERGLPTGDIDTGFTREDAGALAINFEALSADLNTAGWAWYTNSAAFGS